MNKIIKLIVSTVLLSSPVFAITGHDLAKDTYRLSLQKDGSNSCLLPLVDTEKGAVTAGHCLRDLADKGNKIFWGVNIDGTVKEFKLDKLVYEHGTSDFNDFAVLSSKPRGHLQLGNSTQLHKGDTVYVYSPKLGFQTRIVSKDITGTNRFYIDSKQEDCGISGSGVFDRDGKIVGIFIARQYPNDGVVFRIENIFGGK